MSLCRGGRSQVVSSYVVALLGGCLGCPGAQVVQVVALVAQVVQVVACLGRKNIWLAALFCSCHALARGENLP